LEVVSATRIIKLTMEVPLNRKKKTARVIRPGDPRADDRDWETFTPAERIDAVWDLTLLCLAWRGDQTIEPRLQRSVSRIQRSGR
jgi:hypothetical protein